MVAVLFAHQKSVYKTLPCDAWDIDRDARKWPGGEPVVAHPPCRAWGQLRQFALPRDDEKALAIWAVEQVRRFGGVLEHPKGSTLWGHCGLPLGKERDAFGGFTISVDQVWWGHRARKSTWLYVVGCSPRDVPAIPMSFDEPECVVAPCRRAGTIYRPHLPKSQREHTPRDFAIWLCDLAARCDVGRAQAA